MRPRLVVCATVAALSLASGALVGACGSGECSETLTCGDAATEGGEDGTVDSAIDVGSDTATDVTLDAPGDTSADSSDAGDAADGTDGSSDARDSSADATDGASDAPSDALDASDARDAVDDVVEAAVVCSAPSACTPAVPAGFQGPVAFVQEAPSSGDAPSPPACAAPYANPAANGFNDPLFSPTTCTCACGAVSGGCTEPSVQTFTDNQCINPCNSVIAATCVSVGCGATNSNSAIVSAPVASGGSCGEMVQKTVPTWNAATDWGITGRACALSATLPEGGCTGTEVCAPPSPFGSSLCVYASGSVVACPSTYPNQHLIYTSGTDTRTCTDSCSCGAPTGVSCSETTTVASNSTCSAGTLLIPGCGSKPGCACYPMTPAAFASTVVTPSGGSCTPAGSTTPGGGVTPTGPTTVCCTN